MDAFTLGAGLHGICVSSLKLLIIDLFYSSRSSECMSAFFSTEFALLRNNIVGALRGSAMLVKH